MHGLLFYLFKSFHLTNKYTSKLFKIVVKAKSITGKKR